MQVVHVCYRQQEKCITHFKNHSQCHHILNAFRLSYHRLFIWNIYKQTHFKKWNHSIHTIAVYCENLSISTNIDQRYLFKWLHRFPASEKCCAYPIPYH